MINCFIQQPGQFAAPLEVFDEAVHFGGAGVAGQLFVFQAQVKAKHAQFVQAKVLDEQLAELG